MAHRMVLLGPPGSGKGTQAARLVKDLRVIHVSTGAIFREAVKSGSELGKTAKGYMDTGELVPDEVVIGIVTERLSEADAGAGFILDGFPRTVKQAEALDARLAEAGTPLTSVVHVTVSHDTILKRLGGRRSCPECGANYHVEYKRPRIDEICDSCGAGLITRSDDSGEAIKRRIEVDEEFRLPLVDYYRRSGRLVEISGERPPEDVSGEILKAVSAGGT